MCKKWGMASLKYYLDFFQITIHISDAESIKKTFYSDTNEGCPLGMRYRRDPAFSRQRCKKLASGYKVPLTYVF